MIERFGWQQSVQNWHLQFANRDSYIVGADSSLSTEKAPVTRRLHIVTAVARVFTLSIRGATHAVPTNQVGTSGLKPCTRNVGRHVLHYAVATEKTLTQIQRSTGYAPKTLRLPDVALVCGAANLRSEKQEQKVMPGGLSTRKNNRSEFSADAEYRFGVQVCLRLNKQYNT